MYNKEGRILVQKRTDTGKWDLPGGRVELPETIEQGAIREIEEETGIKDISDLRVLQATSNYTPDNDQYFVLIILACTVKSIDSLISDEHQEFSWVDAKNVFTIDMTDYLKEALKKIDNLI